MLKISKLADYGIVLMSNIARSSGDSAFSASDLAASSNLPLPMVSKVLKRLAVKGLLTSQRGAKGGYCLEGDPELISVVDIIVALDGPIALTSCCELAIGVCEIEQCCGTRTNWQLINRRVVQSLSNITLAEMAGPIATEGFMGETGVTTPGDETNVSVLTSGD